MLIEPSARSYEQLVDGFVWDIPQSLNIADVICDRHANSTPLATAIIEDTEKGVRHYSFAETKRLTDNLALSFQEFGIRRGDRVVISLGQDVEALLAHLACFKLGAISVPVAGLYSGEGLAFRIIDSGAQLIVTNREGADKLRDLDIPALCHVVVINQQAQQDEVDFGSLLQGKDAELIIADTAADDAALIFYTSGTTGAPKGVLHAHRMANAHIPCIQLGFEMAPQIGDVFWTASDWSWLGSLGDLVFPALYLGHPVVVTPGRFSVQRAYEVMQRHKITCPFLATAVLRKMSKEPAPKRGLSVRAIMTGGEAMSPEVLKWSQQTFGVPVNDEFGSTESNQTAVACSTLYKTPDGSVGRITPGKRVSILDTQGVALAAGEIGEIAVWHDNPSNMLNYWNEPDKTAQKYLNGWLLTGDRGMRDEQGFLYYYGRLDNLILVNGLRVGPEEVEAQLLAHEKVSEVGVIGVPDDRAGEAIVALIQLKDGIEGSDELVSELQRFVKAHLAAHCYPKRIEFVDELPVTSTGKICREKLRGLLVESLVALG
ncbi:acyl-CoA synthetase [Neptunomonas sp.]|uniref:acyl-CoA synthetase n=1 Tax=Neptunomonas sp. TaxID=1971898 RepID=UPI0035660D84